MVQNPTHRQLLATAAAAAADDSVPRAAPFKGAAGKRMLRPPFMPDTNIRDAGGVAARLPESGASAVGCWSRLCCGRRCGCRLRCL